jgi:hypothetical protein
MLKFSNLKTEELFSYISIQRIQTINISSNVIMKKFLSSVLTQPIT